MSVWGLLSFGVLIVVVVGAWQLVNRITVFEYQHALRFDNGRYTGVLTPGVYWLYTPRSRIESIDTRPQIVTVPGQDLLCADGVSVKISVLCEFKVIDPKIAYLDAADYTASLYAKIQQALRAIVGATAAEDLLSSRLEMSTSLDTQVRPATAALGLELLSIAVKDVMLPGALKEAFAQTLRAKHDSQAALERARGESAALRNLANAARLLENNPNLFQLRLLQTAAEAGEISLTVNSP